MKLILGNTRGTNAGRAACLAVITAMAACGGPAAETTDDADAVAVLLSPENIVIVDSMALASGPTISGSLQPDRVAAIRAEIGGSVLATSAEPGQRVARGATLARIDDAAIRDTWLSARSGVTTAEQSAELARRNLVRSERLAEVGAISESALESARVSATGAEAQLDDARARLAQAQKQLASATITSPMNGVVAARTVNAGDVVTPGTLLFTVVDPSSMRLNAAVPASQLGSIHLGAPVEFRVTGYTGRAFEGTLDRISPTADPATGQIDISAAIPNAGGDLIGGVFAEGRVGSVTVNSLGVPLAAVQQASGAASVLRIRSGVIERVAVQLGIRDEQAEMVGIIAGVSPGDTLLIGSAQGFTPGTTVRMQVDRPAGQ